MVQNALARKLLLKPGYRAVVLNAPPQYLPGLGIEAGEALAGKADSSLDFVQLFATTGEHVRELSPAAIRALKPDGLLWVCYPKGSSRVKTDLSRDILCAMMKEYGMAGVAIVSIDRVWSAMRFRPAGKVGK